MNQSCQKYITEKRPRRQIWFVRFCIWQR